MFRRIATFFKAHFPVHKEKEFEVTPLAVSRNAKNNQAAEVAAREVVSRYGDALKSLSVK